MKLNLKYIFFSVVFFLSFYSNGVQNDTAFVNALNDSSYYLGRLFPEKAYEIAVESKNLAEGLNYVDGEIVAYCRMGNALKKKNELDSALYFYNCAEKLFHEKGTDSILLAKIYIYQGPVYRQIGKYDLALAKYGQLYRLAFEGNDHVLMASALINMNIVFKVKGRYKEALVVLNHALSILPSYSINEIGIVYNSMANIYQDQGRIREAIEALKRAQLHFVESNNLVNLISTQINLGNCYRDVNMKDSALILYQDIYPIVVDRGFKKQEATLCQNMGALFFDQGEIAISEKYFNRSIRLKQESDDLDGQLESLLSLGKVLLLKEDVDSAIILFHEARSLAIEFESIEDLVNISLQLSNGYRKKKNWVKANFYQDESIIYQDSLSSLVAEGLIYEIDYEKEKRKVTELELLVNKQQFQLEKQYNTIWGIAIAAMMAVIVLYMIVRLNIQRRKVAEIENKSLEKQKEISELINKQEQAELDAMYNGQENERNRIASELHDNLGGILSTVKLYFKSMDVQINQLKEENIQQFYKANELLDDACDQTRRIAHELSSKKLGKNGLFKTIEILQDQINDSGQIKLKLTTYGSDEELIQLNQLSIYRVIQELINNILKHAHATEIEIQLNVFEDLFNLIVEDDGVGFDLNKMRTNDGIGLGETEARITNMNGEMIIDTGRGGGTTITIDIPLKTNE